MSARRLRAGALGVLAGLTLALAAASPAHAATPTTIEALQAAFDNADNDPTIVLGADISALDTLLNVPHTASLDLNGFTLDSGDVFLEPGITFTVDDGSVAGTGTWNATGGGSGIAAIATADAEFIVNGGTITAVTNSSFAAGIGGYFDAGGGDIVINGGTVTATGGAGNTGIGGGPGIYPETQPTTVTINGGVVTATGNWGGAGIGGRGAGPGGVLVTINGGTVNATGGFYGAGIGAAEGASSYNVVINGGDVTAVGGSAAAGIGGEEFSSGGTTTITGGTVSAHSAFGAGIGSGQGPGATDDVVEITGGTVTATSSQGAGLGGGYSASIASITIGDGASVTAWAAWSVPTAVGGGPLSSGFGEVTVGGELIIPDGKHLTVPSGELLTVTSTGVVTGDGVIAGDGTIDNHGVIRNSTVANLADGAGLDVTDHDFKVSFGSAHALDAPIDPVRVYAPTFDDGARTLPTPSRSGYVVTEWNTAADGSGTTFAPSTALTADLTLYAQWVEDAFTISPADATVTAGDTQAFTVEQPIAFGTDDVTADFEFTSSDTSDTTSGPTSLGFTAAGVRTITATAIADPSITATTTLTVEPAAADTLTASPSATTVDEGDSVTLTLELLDAYGNPIPTDDVVITSDHPSDLISGTTVTFPTASTHVLTARLGSLSHTVSITVIPAAAGVALTGSDPTVPLVLAGALLALGAGTLGGVRLRAARGR